MPRKAKDELKPKGLQGLSDKLIDNHFDVLYKGYVNKLNEIEESMKTADPAAANATYSIIRELKKGRCSPPTPSRSTRATSRT